MQIASARYRDPDHGAAMEFVAPIFKDGARWGTLRFAAPEPNLLLRFYRSLPEIKFLALILFMVLAVAYALVRRFLDPLRGLADQVSGIVRERSFAAVDGRFAGEVGDLADRWNEMTALFRARFEEMEGAASRLEVSSRLVAYEKKKNEAILDALSDVIVVTNLTGEVVTANRQAETFLGKAKGELQGLAIQKAFGATGVLERLDFFGAGSYSNTVKTTQYTEPAGAGRTFRFSVTPLVTAAGKPNGHMICGRDVTAQLLSDRMKEEFVASVSHEIRTPLASIKSYIEMLMDKEIDDPHTQFEFYNTINDETERLSRLIDNLLNLSKMEAGSLVVNKGPVQLKKLLKEAVRACESQATHKDIKLELIVPETIAAPEMDKDLIGVVVFNLLSNALKYTNKGGEVTVSVEEEDGDLLIRVKDTGIGIPEDAIGNLFRKFYRTEQPEVRERTGSGLGLALSKQIAELHGGGISVESRLSSGSTFTLAIPKD
ncbi:MAG: cell wall metabolism sensor histidine kinase WalK, partial [Candidatus Methylomirabilis sp.]|nr:cell wall metabolism sensor histidine kinase WalK [Deltaproteobacteria bacterium]